MCAKGSESEVMGLCTLGRRQVALVGLFVIMEFEHVTGMITLTCVQFSYVIDYCSAGSDFNGRDVAVSRF